MTQIKLEDRVIKIIDTFSLSDNILSGYETNQSNNVIPEQTSHHISRKNLLSRVYKEASTSNSDDGSHVRDTKNIVKNIFRLFQNWTEDACSSRGQARIALSDLIKVNGK